MFDKIKITADISYDECVYLAQKHRLRTLINTNGEIVGYSSGDYSKISGIFVVIKCRKKNTLYLSVSLHKYWQVQNFGKLRNDNMFTVSEAKSAFEMLLFDNGLLPERVKVSYFEIGLNLNVSHPPLSFIELVKYGFFRNRKGSHRRKIMFVDANYRINRQKTTEKYKGIRKYYKIYDKGFELRGKKRGKEKQSIPISEKDEELKILRIETVYKQHNEKASTFFGNTNIKRLIDSFCLDWKELNFEKNIRAEKGARKSETERAKAIVNIGAEEYLKQAKEDLANRKMTEKQYRTIREFIRDFDSQDTKFKTVVSPQEKEYSLLFLKTLNLSKE